MLCGPARGSCPVADAALYSAFSCAGLLSILNQRDLIAAIVLTGGAMIVISLIAAIGNFAPPPTMPGDIVFTVSGVLIRSFVLFGMLSRYHSYMTKMVEELQERNEQLHQAHDNLETQVLVRTVDLEHQSQKACAKKSRNARSSRRPWPAAIASWTCSTRSRWA